MGIAGFLITSTATAWIIIMVLLLLFSIVAGRGIVGVWQGVLIDGQNTMSLSRFQLLLWTVIVLAAFLAATVHNIVTKQTDPLAIAVPQELWFLLGISTTSLIGTPIIHSLKANHGLNEKEFKDNMEIARHLRLPQTESITTKGVLVANTKPEDANFGDLFRGEEVGNWIHLDLGKLQMFFFTALLALAYGLTLAKALNTQEKITEFPAFTESMLAILAISHAGYLAFKAAPHSMAPGPNAPPSQGK
jgi:hypothetical protein